MAKDKIAILGGRGMLGTDLVFACRQQGVDTLVLDLPDFDITNEKQLENIVRQVPVVVNCAAYTNVDGAESQAELAYRINAEAVGQLGTLAKKHNVFVFHISTDFVFDGKSDRPYLETDLPNPINTYGKSKLAGEQLLAQSGCNHCIIRVQWTYGRAGINFVTKLVARAKAEKNVKVVNDQTGSPTATTEIAGAICRLLPKKPQGCFHFAAAGYVSRFEMAEFIFDNLRIPVNLTRCKSSDFVSPAARPLNSCFNCSKIQALLDEPLRSWQISLKRFLEQL